MAVIAFGVVKYERHFSFALFYFEFYIAVFVCCISIFNCEMTMILYFLILFVIAYFLLTYPTTNSIFMVFDVLLCHC